MKATPKAHSFRVYVGYGNKGAAKLLAIMQIAQKNGFKISKFILKLLQRTYPELPL